MKRTYIFILTALLAVCLTMAATAKQAKDEKKKKGDPRIPAKAAGMKITLRASGNGKVTAGFKNTTGKTVYIKNEFMSTVQDNVSFVRVFLNGNEVAPTGLYSKNMLVRNGQAEISLKSGQSMDMFEVVFQNVPLKSGNKVYISYSSQVFNYEKKKHNWWLGTANSNEVRFDVTRHASVDAELIQTGKAVMVNILSDLANLGKTHKELTGIGGGHIVSGVGAYSGIPQIRFKSAAGLHLRIQVRGADEKLDPVPMFERKFPFLGITVACYYDGGKDARTRNTVFDVIRDRANAFNLLTRDMADQKEMQIRKTTEGSDSLISQAPVIIQAKVVSAKQERGTQNLWLVTVAPRKTLKGAVRGETIYLHTDNPTVRFKGAFINRQFIMFLKLKYQEPETYDLLGADYVSSELVRQIKDSVDNEKKKKK